jgi:WD repeat-containing protein 23
MQDNSNLLRLRHYFRLLQQQLLSPQEETEEEEEVEDQLIPAEEASASSLVTHSLAQELAVKTLCHPTHPDMAIFELLRRREASHNAFSAPQRRHITQRMLPQPNALLKNESASSEEIVAEYENQAFCGRFTSDGRLFVSACQDRHIRLYNCAERNFRLIKDIAAKDVGWSIIDTDFSPDQRFLIYSSWSDYIHLCNIEGEQDIHESLNLRPQSHRFCLFSIQFSHTSSEIVAGSSDRCLYVYDVDRRDRVLRINGHADDVNTVCWADETSQILFSGSDDCLCKVWDRRQLQQGKPAGVLVGHLEGITHISSKDDGRYFLSNSKDQSIKLWDLRMMSDAAPRVTRLSSYDYRHGEYFTRGTQKKIFEGKLVHADDRSLKTYRGHRVFQTLIRAYFSPEATTGQRYIYTGSYDGCCYIYDIITGDIVAKLDGHAATVRDVSWHPVEPVLMTTSWDGTIRKWTFAWE